VSEHATVIDYSTPGARLHHEPPTLFDSLGEPGHAHHFQEAGQQKEASTLGMWLFLGTEVMFFGAMFTGYFAYRFAYPHAWEMGSLKLFPSIGSVNTAVLLTSSLCVALAIHAAHAGNRKGIVRYLLLTILFGAMFLGIKGVEYYLDYREHLIPWGSHFEPEFTTDEMKILPADIAGDPARMEQLSRQVRLFMLFYFIMTLIHAIPMIAGISVMGLLTWMSHRGRFSPAYYTPVEMAGLYWHFVDIVWVFLLPALYFVRPYHHVG
jgi:cytochrome c oxidase subunit III